MRCSERQGLLYSRNQNYLRRVFLHPSHNPAMDHTNYPDEGLHRSCSHTTRCSWSTGFHERWQTLTTGNLRTFSLKSPNFVVTLSSNHGSPLHLSENYKWLANEWRHFWWTSYGTMKGDSCSIRVHLGWLACRADRRLCPWTQRHCSARSETGSESMLHLTRTQSRRRLEMVCSVGP